MNPATDRGNLKSPAEKKGTIEHRDFKDKDFLFDQVRRCKEGKTESMEHLYHAYKIPVMNLAYRFTGDSCLAEDLLQDIFIKVFVNIKKLRSPEAFNSWLYRIAVNTCMSFARKRGKSRELPFEDIEDAGSAEDVGKNIRRQLEQAVNILPPRQKAVFHLHDVQGFTHREIAGIMGCSAGTAKSQLFKARMKIRNFLKD